MSMCERDIPDNAKAFIIEKIIRNAEIIQERISSFEMTRDSYARLPMHQDLLTMSPLRISELVSEYRSVFEKMDLNYPRRDVAKMGCKIAHPYEGFDFDLVWDAIQIDLPGLVEVCRRAIG